MWQEARKQEKKLRGIMIDYKKRAERRQAFYARMRMDPHQLMRIYGQKCKFHMVPENAKVNADGQLMPWQGDPEVMIDRFDVRAHLDYIDEPNHSETESLPVDADEEKFQRKCSYERYRTLVQIDATGASEEQYLKQLDVEDTISRTEMENKKRMQNDKLRSKANAKFHYKYDDSTDISNDLDDSSDDSSSDSSASDGELSDIDINVNVLDLSLDQTNHLDALATQYGIGYGQYCKQLLLEKKEFEYVKKLEEEEEERAKMPGRKGKSARRFLRAKQKTLRGSPLSFAVHESSPQDDDKAHRERSSSSDESSRSKSPVNTKVEFITEFGGDNVQGTKKNGIGDTLPSSSDSRKKSEERSSSHQKRSRHRSSSHSKSHGKHSTHDSRSRDRQRSKSRSRDRHKNSENSRSRSRDRHSKNSHSSHSSRTRRESHNDSIRSYSSSTYRSRSRSPKNNENNHEYNSRGIQQKSRDKSEKRSRSRSRSLNRSHNQDMSKIKKEKRSRARHENIVQRLGTDVEPTPVLDKSMLTPREKMKLRMQKLLNRQIKSDKKEEHKKQVAKEQEIEERDMEIYEMSRLMRMREREKKMYRSPSPKGRMPSYDASRFHYRAKSKSPV